MIVKELKEYIAHLPDECVVKFEYDGSDAYVEREATGFIIADDNSEILLTHINEWENN